MPYFRSSRSEMSLRKGVLKICNKCIGEHPCRNAISVKLLLNFIEITHRHACSPVNLLHIFRTSFSKSTSGWLLPICHIYKPFTLSSQRNENSCTFFATVPSKCKHNGAFFIYTEIRLILF